jgi:ketosteroid isomerase-like protein
MRKTWVWLLAVTLPDAAGFAQKRDELEPAALKEMVETERAFAAMGAEKGVRESFFEFFGEDGIAFNPHPGKFRENARKNPVPANPPPREFKLEWWPVYGDVAESGDLGYNTGPTLVTDLTAQNRPARHGYFFSVWKRQRDGNWRVAVDMGVSTPGVDKENQDRARYIRAPQENYKKTNPAGAAAGRAELMKLESEFLKAATHHGGRDGYLGYMAGWCRVHRPRMFPILRQAAAQYFDSVKLEVVQWEGMDGGVAGSGELGYTYGRYEFKLTEGGAERREKGYFTRVWKRSAEGEWKLVAEVANPLPAGH